MTIPAQTRKAGPYAGDGTNKTFPFAFKVFASADLQVLRTSAVGVETVLTTGYAVDFDPMGVVAGGSIKLDAAPSAGEKITILGVTPIEQPLELTNSGGFYPMVLNAALDKQTAFAQQNAEKIGRALKFAASDDVGGAGDLPHKAQRVGRVLAFEVGTGKPVAGPTIANTESVGGAVAAIEAVASKLTIIETVSGHLAEIADAPVQAAAAAASALIAENEKIAAENSATAASQSELSSASYQAAAYGAMIGAETSANEAMASAVAAANSESNTSAMLGTKVDKVAGKGLSSQDFQAADKLKLATVQQYATANKTDAYLLNRANHTGTQPMESITDKQGKVLDDLIEIEDVNDIETTFAVGGYIIKEDDLNGYYAGATMLVSANGGVVSQLVSAPLIGKIATRRYEAGVWSEFSFTLAPFDVQLWYSNPTASAADAVINADGTFGRSLFVPAPLAPKITVGLTAEADTDILRPYPLTAATTFPNPTGTPMDGFGFVIELIDDGTARALTWGSDYAAGFAALPTMTTAGKLGQIAVQYRSGKYRCDGVRWMA